MKSPRRSPVLLGAITLLAIVAGIVMTTQGERGSGSIAAETPNTPAERDDARKKSLEAIAAAIRTSTTMNKGRYPFLVPRTETAICSATTATCRKAKLLDLNQLVSDGTITTIPSDPNGGRGQYSTGFSLRREPDGVIVLLAPRAETRAISVRLQ